VTDFLECRGVDGEVRWDNVGVEKGSQSFMAVLLLHGGGCRLADGYSCKVHDGVVKRWKFVRKEASEVESFVGQHLAENRGCSLTRVNENVNPGSTDKKAN
jgi:hypothetical protein